MSGQQGSSIQDLLGGGGDVNMGGGDMSSVLHEAFGDGLDMDAAMAKIRNAASSMTVNAGEVLK